LGSSEHTPRTPPSKPRPEAPAALRPQPTESQIEAKVAHELNNLLNVVALCGDRLASSPEVTAAARLDLLALAGRVAHAIIDARRRGVSLRRWIGVNTTLRHLEAAVRLLLSPAIEVALELDPSAGSVHLAPGELDLVILNLVLDARSRLAGSGRLAIRSQPGDAQVAITVVDEPREGSSTRAIARGTHFGLTTVGLIARDAGGRVELRHQRDGGCEVKICLPVRPEAD
jgi:signal transduction histidine kinase